MSEYLSIQPASRDPFAIGPREHLNQILSIVAMSRNGDNRFLPLLLNKVSDVLPRLINPMLQNAPENTPMASMDMFDGFGTAGMAQPPAQMSMAMDGDYDRKFSVEEYEKKYAMEMNANTSPESGANSNNSPPVSQQQPADLNTSFVNSPAIMSPVMDYPHGMNSFAMNDMVMSPIGNPGQSSSMGSSQQMNHPPQQMSHNHDALAVQHHMNNMRNSGVTPAPLPMNSIISMRPPQPRQGSFHMPNQPTMRTVGDFHGLQRANSEMAGLNPMSNEIDFGALR